jgi:hypothetical protein
MSFHSFPSNLTKKLMKGFTSPLFKTSGGYTANFETLGFKLKTP